MCALVTGLQLFAGTSDPQKQHFNIPLMMLNPTTTCTQLIIWFTPTCSVAKMKKQKRLIEKLCPKIAFRPHSLVRSILPQLLHDSPWNSVTGNALPASKSVHPSI